MPQIPGINDILRQLLAKTAVLLDWRQRAALCARLFAELPTIAAAALFDHLLLTRFSQPTPELTTAAHALFISILDGLWSEELITHVREAAAANQERLTSAFLWWPPSLDEAGEQKPLSINLKERPLTLGERKYLASKPTRASVGRALLDPHPQVTEKVLSNPRTKLDDVVTAIARQVTPPAVLAEVGRHNRWRVHQKVQLALVNNKHTPVVFALSVLPFIPRKMVRQVARDERLHESIRQGAVALLSTTA